MARSIRKSKAPGYEYWSRRPFSNNHGSQIGAFAKRRTHRAERQEGRHMTRDTHGGFVRDGYDGLISKDAEDI